MSWMLGGCGGAVQGDAEREKTRVYVHSEISTSSTLSLLSKAKGTGGPGLYGRM
jgi:hypothetical protein